MKKLVPIITLIAFAIPALAQNAYFDDLNDFSRVIFKGNVTEVRIEKGDNSITINGAAKDQVNFELSGGVLTITLPNSSGLTASISARDLRWIEAAPETHIVGTDYLKGGNGKFLVLNPANSQKIKFDHNYKYQYAFDTDAIKIKVGDYDYNYNYDFDYDFDFNFDFDFDFDYDFDFDFDWDN